MSSSSLTKELVFLILQYLDEEKYKETVRKLEMESGLFFNMRYFEDAVNNGELEEAEKYLSGFTKIDDNLHSKKIFFELRKQKYLEALDDQDRARALEILRKDLKVFSTSHEKLYKELTQLLPLPNFRENEQLSGYTDTKSIRANLLVELKKLIERNPILHDKLQFPDFRDSRLKMLINQSLTWQHTRCENPKPNRPDIDTLFTDHRCVRPNGAQALSPVTNPFMASPIIYQLPRVGKYPSIRGAVPFQQAPAIIAHPSSVLHQAVSLGNTGVIPPNIATDSEHVLKSSRPFVASEEVSNLPGGTHAHSLRSTYELRFMDSCAGTTSQVPVIGTLVASGSAAGPSMGEDRSSPVAPAIALNSDSMKLQDPKSKISNELLGKAYISSPSLFSISKSYPSVIASNPSEANQFALGMADGGVYVLEPLESQGESGTAPEQHNIAGTSKSKSKSKNKSKSKSGAEDQSSRS